MMLCSCYDKTTKDLREEKTMRKKKKLGAVSTFTSLWKDRTLIVMALPAVILMILFNYVPMTGLVLAFKKFDYSLGLYNSPWNGLENFKHLFLAGNTYWRITRNTVGYYLLFTAVGVVCQVGLAVAINNLTFRRAGKYMHSIMIMPTFISYVAVAYIVKALLDYNTGMINSMLASGGADKVNFYLQAGYWPLILTLVAIWKETGYGSVLYLSALAGIDQEMYESASLDGANAWQKMRYITLPMLVPVIMVKLLLGLGYHAFRDGPVLSGDQEYGGIIQHHTGFGQLCAELYHDRVKFRNDCRNNVLSVHYRLLYGGGREPDCAEDFSGKLIVLGGAP